MGKDLHTDQFYDFHLKTLDKFRNDRTSIYDTYDIAGKQRTAQSQKTDIEMLKEKFTQIRLRYGFYRVEKRILVIRKC